MSAAYFQILFISAHACYPIQVPKVFRLAKHNSGKYMCTRLGIKIIKAKINSKGSLPIVTFNFNREDVATVEEFVQVLR